MIELAVIICLGAYISCNLTLKDMINSDTSNQESKNINVYDLSKFYY